jgi:excisionase family DNA binding protein
LEDELLTLEEVKTILKVHIETVREWVRKKKLPAIRLSYREYRVRRSDLNKFLQERQTTSDQPEQEEDPQ